MSTAGLFAGSCGSDGLNSALQDIAELESFNKIPVDSTSRKEARNIRMHIRIPNHAPVLDTDIVIALVDGSKLLNTFIQGLLSPELF